MRGFQSLKKAQKLDIISLLKDELSNIPLTCTVENTSSIVFGAGTPRSELILKQFLLVKVLGIKFNERLLLAANDPRMEIKHPLPPEWRIVLEKHGFKADTLRNKIEWIKFIFFYLLSGYASIVIQLFTSLKQLLFPGAKLAGNSAYFQSLAINNLPITVKDGGTSHDIITWYYRWEKRVHPIDGIYHSIEGAKTSMIDGVPIVAVPSAIPSLGNLVLLLRYFIWGVQASILSLIDIFRSRYWHALLLRESSKSGQIRLLKPESLASDYLFHNSNHIFRPLWTYDAEKMGSRIIFYFYSTNCETFKTSSGYPLQEHTWHIISWPNYLVWDKHQHDFIKRAVGNDKSEIHVVGPIWFSSSDKEIPTYDAEKSIAVFDVQPMRESRYQLLGQANGFNTPFTTNQFLQDISEITKKHNAKIVFKRKRHIGKLVHKKYYNLVEQLTQSQHFLSVDPEVDAIRLIEKSLAVISMPFTSTAILAKELGKPTIYYDPNGQIQKDDRAAHDIRVVCGKAELDEWMNDIIKLAFSPTNSA